LNKGAGIELAKAAFQKSYPQATPPGWSMVRKEKSSMTYAPETVIEFYKMFPDYPKDPKTGLPPGYPVNEDRYEKRRWVAKLAIRVDKERSRGMDAEVTEPGEAESPTPVGDIS
jgi:hypothetical protein